MAYDLILILYFFSKFFFERVFLRKKRSALLQRLGLQSYPPLKKKGTPLIWIHAVSVGEAKAAATFLHKLRGEYPHATIIVSSVTETGHEEAKRSLKDADLHLFLPFDFSFSIRRVLQAFPIELLFFIETDLWYNFIRLAKKQGAKVFLVSGKISQRSANRYRLGSFFSKKLFFLFDRICCQSEPFKERFVTAGAPLEKLCVTGNLKFDLASCHIPEKEKLRWRKQFSTSASDRFVTIASTHAKEEEGILASLSEFLTARKEVRLFLAPRHPERFSSVAKLLAEKGFSYTTLSCLEKDKQIILIDRLGFLPICFSLSRLAILGGSFVDKIGGHNIFEPISYQIPVLFGPFMFAQEEMVGHVLKQSCGAQISLSDLGPSVARYFDDTSWAERLSKNCLSLLKKTDCASQTLRSLKSSL